MMRGWNLFYPQMMAGSWWGVAGFGFGFLFFLLLAWSLFWKGMALWRAARRGEKVWFLVLLVVNTVGILEILYLYVFSKKEKSVEGADKDLI
jgi:hypothetical protein